MDENSKDRRRKTKLKFNRDRPWLVHLLSDAGFLLLDVNCAEILDMRH